MIKIKGTFKLFLAIVGACGLYGMTAFVVPTWWSLAYENQFAYSYQVGLSLIGIGFPFFAWTCLMKFEKNFAATLCLAAYAVLVGVTHGYERICNAYVLTSQTYIGVSPKYPYPLTLSIGIYIFVGLGILIAIFEVARRKQPKPYDVTAPVMTLRGEKRKFLKHL